MVSPRTSLRTVFPLVAALYLPAAAGLRAQQAQDLPARVFLQGNPTPQEGRMTSVQGDAIQLTIPGGKTSVPLAQVARIEAAPPAAYATGISAYNAGNFDKALADLRSFGEAFRGLPTDWEQQTLSALGSIYLDKNDTAKAEAAFNDLRRYYPKAPGSGLQLSVAQARISFAKNNSAQAKGQLDAIIQAALKSPAEVTRADGAAYGQACYLMARLQERDSNFQGALESYLRVVALFYQDATLTTRAQKGADELRAAHKDVSVP